METLVACFFTHEKQGNSSFYEFPFSNSITIFFNTSVIIMYLSRIYGRQLDRLMISIRFVPTCSLDAASMLDAQMQISRFKTNTTETNEDSKNKKIQHTKAKKLKKSTFQKNLPSKFLTQFFFRIKPKEMREFVSCKL